MGQRILSSALWPLWIVGYGAFVATIATRAPHMLGPAMALTIITSTLALVGFEQVLPYRAQWTVRGDRDILRDIAHGLLYGSLGGNVVQLAVLGTAGLMFSATGLNEPHGVWPARSPMVVQILLVIVLADALEYAYHRLTHTVGWLWPLHAIHHSPVRLNAVKASRHHLLYMLGRGLLVWLPIVALGAPPERPGAWKHELRRGTSAVGHSLRELHGPAVGDGA